MLVFNGSNKPTIGVEIELQILDPESFDLVPRSEEILRHCHKKGLQRVKAEVHQSMLEVDSEISFDVKECQKYLQKRIFQAMDIAESMGLRLGVTGTHPFQKWPDRLISNCGRYHLLHDKFQWLIRRVNVYGLHVHVGMPSGETALAVSNSLMRYLPHFLALSANSPFWQGVDTGMQSSRITIMESFPYAGLPPFFANWQELSYYHDTLLQAEAITSLKDLYWFVRPNLAFGTLEFRICDAMSSMAEIMAVVSLIHCLAVRAIEKGKDHFNKEQLWLAPENLWTAARDGVEGIIIDPSGKRTKIADEIEKLIEELLPLSKALNGYEELIFLRVMLAQGTGAKKQRENFQKTQSLVEVVKERLQVFEESIYAMFLP